MPGLLQRFLPREETFFDLFVQQGENIQAGARALVELLSHYTGVPEQAQSIKQLSGKLTLQPMRSAPPK